MGDTTHGLVYVASVAIGLMLGAISIGEEHPMRAVVAFPLMFVLVLIGWALFSLELGFELMSAGIDKLFDKIVEYQNNLQEWIEDD